MSAGALISSLMERMSPKFKHVIIVDLIPEIKKDLRAPHEVSWSLALVIKNLIHSYATWEMG